MTCNAAHLVRHAREIAETEDTEPHHRAVASRAYYGAHHAAKVYHRDLPSPGSNKDGNGSHQALISQLRNPTVKGRERHESIAIGTLLMAAFAIRIHADYRLEEAFSYVHASENLSMAEQIVGKTAPSDEGSGDEPEPSSVQAA